MDESLTQRSALLLIATESEWAGRSLESELMHHGYSVLRTHNGNDALAMARRTRPDAVILDQHMREISGIDVCRLLRDDPHFDPATPIVVIAGSPASQAEHAAAYAAGAWTFCTQPLDPDILVHELATFLRAKRAITVARDNSLVDPATGLLNPGGMDRWAEQLAARATRNKEPLACIVLMSAEEADSEADDATDLELNENFVEMSRAHMRQSDIVGLTRDGRLALLAPDTDGAGVRGLIQRLRDALDAASKVPGAAPPPDFRAGYCAVDDFAETELPPAELMLRASRALEHGRNSSDGEMLFDFSRIPLS